VDKNCRKSGLNAEYFVDNSYSGKPLVKRVDKNAKVVWEREVASGAVRWTGFIKAPESGEYTMRYVADGGYRIWINDQVVINAWNVDWRPVIASGSVKMEAGKIYPIKIEAFQRGEQGDEHLVWSLPSNPGADTAIDIAKKSDVIVYVGGITAQVEGEEMPVPLPGFVGGDRTDLSLPRAQTELLKRLYATGKPVVVVLMNGSALAVNQEDNLATAIVEAWYPGGQGGEAVASILAGDISPAGRLPVTFYKSITDLPEFGDYSMKNRTYKYHKGEVLYPFGYGLSYSEFKYNDVKISPTQFKSGKLNLSVAVTNAGNMDSDEVVQVYLSRKDLAGSPIRSLIGFKRVHIVKGTTQKVNFELSERDLSSVDENGKRALFAGKADLWIGGGQPEQRVGLVPAAGIVTSVIIKANKDI
jgi:beta-glucosidase